MTLKDQTALIAKKLKYRLKPKRPYSVLTETGQHEIFHIDEYSERWFYRNINNLNGWHEPSLSWLLLLAGQNGGKCFLDVGAHMGYFSLLHTFKDSNRAFSLELDPLNFKNLKKIVERAATKDIQLFNCGAAATSGEIKMPVTTRPSPTISLQQKTEALTDMHVVPICTLDDFATSNKMSPDIVKIDVEGAEYGVIEGAKHILSKAKPIVVIEVHPAPLAEMDNKSPEDLADLLIGHGYAVFQFSKNRGPHCSQLHPFKETDGSMRDFDLVCIDTENAAYFAEKYNKSIEKLDTGTFPDFG